MSHVIQSLIKIKMSFWYGTSEEPQQEAEVQDVKVNDAPAMTSKDFDGLECFDAIAHGHQTLD